MLYLHLSFLLAEAFFVQIVSAGILIWDPEGGVVGLWWRVPSRLGPATISHDDSNFWFRFWFRLNITNGANQGQLVEKGSCAIYG